MDLFGLITGLFDKPAAAAAPTTNIIREGTDLTALWVAMGVFGAIIIFALLILGLRK
jgi:hypothetical protein